MPPSRSWSPSASRKPSISRSNSVRKSPRPKKISSPANSTSNSPATNCCRPCRFKAPWGSPDSAATTATSFTRNFSGDFYNYGAGLVLSYPLGNRAAVSTYNKRQLEAKNAEITLSNVRQQIIVGVREAVRRVQTDFKRIETTRSARIMAEKQLQAEQERLKVGLSTTRFVLDFQRDLATAQGNELRAIVDYNKSLSNLARHKATTLDRYHLELS